MQVTLTIPTESVYGVTAARALYNSSLPATVTQDDGSTIPNPAIINSDEMYVVRVLSKAVESWCAQTNVAPPPPPPTPVVINGVPQEVTRRQAIQALINSGKYALVQTAINAIVDPTQRATMQNEWDNSQTFQRQRPALIAMATAIGLSTTDLDNLFVVASAL